MKHLLKLGDLSPAEILHVLDVADELKRLHRAGQDPKVLAGRAVALIFNKNSTRTRTSFEVGIYQMGGLGTFLNAATELQIARGEPIQDTARVLGRYYDALVYRTYKPERGGGAGAVQRRAGDLRHDRLRPPAAGADRPDDGAGKAGQAWKGVRAGFVGDGYNMANSLIVGCLKAGMTLTVACPKGYRPAADVLRFAAGYGDRFRLTADPDEAARDAQVLFTDVWISMGMEREAERRRRDFAGFTLDAARMALAAPGCLVQHPLPARRGEEITDEVLEAHAADIFDEAENRLHVEKAVLAILLAGY